MQKTIVHTIKDKSPQTKKDVEVFSKLIEQGYIILDVFNYKNEFYYVMARHVHEDGGEEFSN